MIWWVATAVLVLAYANGANDAFKGVATLLGSGVSDYRRALLWGIATTFAGAMAALFIAEGLLATFSGAGLVDPAVATSPAFALAVAGGAAGTVLLAARLGMPISTTHALVGALVGAALASRSGIHWNGLWQGMVAPLLFSPLAALALTLAAYPLLHRARQRLGVARNTCVCIGNEVVGRFAEGTSNSHALTATTLPAVTLGTQPSCRQAYAGAVVGIEAGNAIDRLHYLSAGAVGFARGVNDAPKIAALLLLAPAFGAAGGILLVAAAMAVGGLLGAARVAHTMAHRITPMNAGQGLIANLVTAFLVIFASRFGLPVSTTQVSVGALFGIGATTGSARKDTITAILLSWVATLPLAAALSALVWFLLRAWGNA
ncbi:MAG: inorganic phosphate transporter [Salinisphaera sp.]|nr:inorganic phosphate transporter [Salinisphaera sp.]